jgi:ribosomal protein S18 acetylase RimI-like enzyme
MIIDAIRFEDFPEWLVLWQANNNGHIEEEITQETWNRLLKPEGQVRGLAARMDGKLVGLVHYILHPVTGHVKPACYMQDLYVDPQYRRRGIGRALVERLTSLAQRGKWARLYWLADENNAEAQTLYRNLGLRLDFSFYVMPLQA